jgi:hypothetical protein
VETTAEGFRRYYEGLSDEGLLAIRAEDLTETARVVYLAEMARRGIEAEAASAPPEAPRPEAATATGDWVEIAGFALPADAKLARAELEAEGIPCLIPDERTLDADGGLVNAFGGIKLCVPASCAEEARAILGSTVSDDELEAQALASPPPDDVR